MMDFQLSGTVLVKHIGTDVDVIIPDGITKIQGGAFTLWNLRTVSIPDGVELEKNAFRGCINLKKIIFRGENIQITPSSFEICLHISQIVAPESLIPKLNNCFSKCVSFFTPDGRAVDLRNEFVIRNGALWSCSRVAESCSVPDSVKSILHAAFNSAAVLKELWIPDSVEDIGCAAILNCPELESISLPATAKLSIGAIEDCPKLKTLIFRGNEPALDTYPTRNCRALNRVVASEQVMTKIHEYLPAKVKYFTVDGKQLLTPAQQEAEDRKNTLKKSSIGAAKKSSTDITLLKGIDKNASVIVLPNGINVIPADAFKDCVNLKKIVISKDVTSIEARAFSGCLALEQLVFMGTVTSVAPSAFQKCKAIQKIVADTSTTKLIKNAITSSSVVFLSVPKAKTAFEKRIFPEIEKNVALYDLVLWAGETKSKIVYADDGKPASELLLTYVRYAYANQVRELPDCNKSNYNILTVELQKSELADQIADVLDRKALMEALEKFMPACCFEYRNDSWKFKKEKKGVFAGEPLVALLKKARNMASGATVSTTYESCIIENSPADVIPYIRYASVAELESILQSFALWGDSSLFAAKGASRAEQMELSAVAKGGRQSVALVRSAMPLNDDCHHFAEY